MVAIFRLVQKVYLFDNILTITIADGHFKFYPWQTFGSDLGAKFSTKDPQEVIETC